MIKLEQEDVVTKRVGGNIAITPPGEKLGIILDPDAVVEFISDAIAILREAPEADWSSYMIRCWADAQAELARVIMKAAEGVVGRIAVAQEEDHSEWIEEDKRRRELEREMLAEEV